MQIKDQQSLCAVDRVSLSSFQRGLVNDLGNGHLLINSNEQQIDLRFINYYGEERASINLTPKSKAWLQPDQQLIFDRPEGGRWRLDCSASDINSFQALQDLLTFFIKYENRHHLRNALAMMNPVSCQVTEVIARNVQLEDEDTQSEKQPVVMETPMVAGGFKVRLLYKTSDAMVTGSDWLAQSFVLAGQSLARGIQIQTRKMRDNVEATGNTIRLTEVDRQYVETFCNVNRSILKGAGNLLSKATTAATSSINSFYSDDQLQRDPVENATRHFGVSLFHAAHNVVAGLSVATGSVLASSRNGVIDMIYKKYGSDAGFIAEKALGSGNDDVADVLVYFDSHGVARQVFVGTSVVPTTNTSLPDKEIIDNGERRGSHRSVLFEAEDFRSILSTSTSETPIHPLEDEELQSKRDQSTYIHV
ncbi:hypothetical protein BDC45DRAFT_608714 [Circinella umbellata]|nr:hypothetical protein BDC45DRAFT_608714 [Circinella umbellata]